MFESGIVNFQTESQAVQSEVFIIVITCTKHVSRVLTTVNHTPPLNLADDPTHSHITKVQHLCHLLVTDSTGSGIHSHPHLAAATRAQVAARYPVLSVRVLARLPPTLPRCQTQRHHLLS